MPRAEMGLWNMLALTRFLFLVLLLFVDWYFDTSFGRSAFEGPLASTLAVSKAAEQKERVCKEYEVKDLIQTASLVQEADLCLSVLMLLPEGVGPFFLPEADRIYVYMSMQC